jgi:hypothetical protein
MLSVVVDGALYLLRQFMIVGAGVLVWEAPDIHRMEANRRRQQTDSQSEKLNINVFSTLVLVLLAQSRNVCRIIIRSADGLHRDLGKDGFESCRPHEFDSSSGTTPFKDRYPHLLRQVGIPF